MIEIMDQQDKLVLASKEGQLDIVNSLIDAKADVDKQDKYGYTALILASRYGHLEIVNNFIGAKADVDKQNIYGSTALI